MPVRKSKPFRMNPASLERPNQRFDLILRDVRHIGVSYEGRIFFNNPDANEETEKTPETGYAGSFYV